MCIIITMTQKIDAYLASFVFIQVFDESIFIKLKNISQIA